MMATKRVLAGILLAACASLPAAAGTSADLAPAPVRAKVVALVRSSLPPQAAETATYVGPESCIACHTSYAPWRTSAHATMHAIVPDDLGSMQPDKGIIFDGNKNGIDDFKESLDFNKISSAFNAYKPNAPILSFATGQRYPYRVTIGTITYIVGIKEGGYYQQRLIVRIPVTDGPGGLSTSLYMLPFAYSPRYREYALYNPDRWWAADGKPKIVSGMTAAQVAGIGRNWTQSCMGCHVTGYTVGKTATGEWWGKAPVTAYPMDDRHYVDINQDGTRQFMGVSCESCHLAGSLHVLGNGDKTKILNPASLTKKQQTWLCAQCHTRGLSVPAGLHDYPYDETADKPYQVGDDVFRYLHDEAGRWPDGKTPTKGEQQYQSHMVSPHFTNAVFHPVTCSDCHDPHSGERGLPVTKQNGVATSLTNNTLCLSCHAGSGPFKELTVGTVGAYEQNKAEIALVVSKHTFHAYTPEKFPGQSNCVTCHMPKTAKRDYSYDETSHTMEAIPPEKTLTYQAKGGMPSSCAASCHGGRPLNFNTAFTNDDFSKWNEVSDQETAKILKTYFGPDGKWWDTAAKGSATGRALATAPRPDAPEGATPGRPD